MPLSLTLDDLRQIVKGLPRDEFAQFRQWVADYDSEQWDRQQEADAESGRLDWLAEEALSDYREGRTKEL